jgi:hypothetical protein
MDHAVRGAIRVRIHDDRVNDAEDGGGGRNSESEREDRGDREPRFALN